MIRFHLDENVNHAVARGLRLRGIDVSTATSANLISAFDTEHIAFALRENRVIFTEDQDFLRHHHAGRGHAGVVSLQKRAAALLVKLFAFCTS